MKDSSVPSSRIRALNEISVNVDGDYVLYWMTSFRRLEQNFALQRAVDWALELDRPLIVFEVLKGDYPWASPRIHQFVIEGILEKAEAWNTPGAVYYPFVEEKVGAQKGLLKALAKQACIVVTDDFPCFFIPQMLDVAGKKLPVRLEAVDANGIVPLAAVAKEFSRAYHFRRFLQKNLPGLIHHPKENPLQALPTRRFKIPGEILQRWPGATMEQLKEPAVLYQTLGFGGGPTTLDLVGGSSAARKRLRDFLAVRLDRYSEERNQPAAEMTSGLSPYLHFGFISADEVFRAVLQRAGCRPEPLESADGKVDTWWPRDAPSREFLDQLLTWRELGFNGCWFRDDFDQLESLPGWAQQTLAEHADDPRQYRYSLQQFEGAKTHDPIWNAAQRQLVREGIIHNYLRMVWGKKILEWTASPREALEVMIELNNKYALDGRDPNSYSGIFWCLGRYDRAWGPERPIFGKIRYMSSENTARKLKLKPYLERYGEGSSQGELF